MQDWLTPVRRSSAGGSVRAPAVSPLPSSCLQCVLLLYSGDGELSDSVTGMATKMAVVELLGAMSSFYGVRPLALGLNRELGVELLDRGVGACSGSLRRFACSRLFTRQESGDDLVPSLTGPVRAGRDRPAAGAGKKMTSAWRALWWTTERAFALDFSCATQPLM